MEAMIPPPDGDRNRGNQAIIIKALFTSLAFIFVLLRLYVGIAIRKRLGLDDLFIVLGLVSTLSECQSPP